MLYKNAKETNKKVTKILADGNKAKETIKNMAMKIYDGYNSGVDNLKINEGLPKYLLNDKDALKQVNKLKNSMLKLSYKKILENMTDINSKAFKKAMHSALQERARYYAKRIAQTEAHRSSMLSRAKEYLDDDNVEFVKFRMSSGHKITDICDYYSSLDVGYGVGIVPKEQMRVLPLHPHCHCVYDGYYKKVKKKTIKYHQKNTLNKFSNYEQQQILGSKDKLQDFRDGADVEEIFNRVRPKYKIGLYGDVLGYNSDMKVFSRNNITKDEISSIELWSKSAKNAGIIRDVVRKDFINLTSTEDEYKDDSKNILDMFSKYDTDVTIN